MQTIILLLILLLFTIFSTLLYLKNKTSRVEKLNSGQCPNCHAKTKIFYDEKMRTSFKTEVIKANLLKNHGCSGIKEFEYTCTNCDLKEVHTQN